MLLTLRNSFHNSAVRIKPRWVSGCRYVLSHAVVLRTRRALCGLMGCTCGDSLGRRGPQDRDFMVMTTDAGFEIYLDRD